MSCNHCTTKFNFFHREAGCPSCGLSFCNKCLKQKCKIPNKGSGEFNVCKTCHNKLTTDSQTSMHTIIPPPDAYLNRSFVNSYPPDNLIIISLLRRLEALENPSAPPITVYKHDRKLEALRPGLSPVDQQLIDRLEKLKEDKNLKSPPTEDELRERLATLKGENQYVQGPSKTVVQSDSRTDQQKVDDLLVQFVSERDIELAHNPQEEIEARLASLREKGVRPNEGSFISNLHDSSGSEEDVDKITKKIMDEVALEEKAPNCLPSDSRDNPGEASPELPWCVLCNKDARVRCLDCGGDLYCAECNKEVHKTWDNTHHKIVNFNEK